MRTSFNRRCSICNSVDNEDIETGLGEYKQDIAFTIDPSSHMHWICIECHDEIQDVLSEWDHEDWEN